MTNTHPTNTPELSPDLTTEQLIKFVLLASGTEPRMVNPVAMERAIAALTDREERLVQAAYGLGATHEKETHNHVLNDEFFERQAAELAQLSNTPNEGEKDAKQL